MSLLSIAANNDWLNLPTLNLKTGQVCSLFGESGSGKSRLLRSICDLDPNSLDVTLDGKDRSSFSAPAWRQQLQYLPAEPVWWTETAAEMLNDQTINLASSLGLKTSLLEQPIKQLSTGERQRCALLRALSVAPSILLLDEPTAALDEDSTALVEALLATWVNSSSRAIVWVSHDKHQRQRISQQQWHIKGGELICQ